MLVNYTTDAFASLSGLINFIESKNTAGAGRRWLEKYEQFLMKALNDPKTIRWCNNETFQKLNLKCIYYKDWVIAFSVENDVVLIEALLHSSRISD